jgi:hypothetical protein
VNYGAKYLCKAVSVNTGKMLKPLTKEEAEYNVHMGLEFINKKK